MGDWLLLYSFLPIIKIMKTLLLIAFLFSCAPLCMLTFLQGSKFLGEQLLVVMGKNTCCCPVVFLSPVLTSTGQLVNYRERQTVILRHDIGSHVQEMNESIINTHEIVLFISTHVDDVQWCTLGRSLSTGSRARCGQGQRPPFWDHRACQSWCFTAPYRHLTSCLALLSSAQNFKFSL